MRWSSSTGVIPPSDPYAMNATLLRIAVVLKSRMSLVMNVRRTSVEAMYPTASVIMFNPLRLCRHRCLNWTVVRRLLKVVVSEPELS